MRRSRMARATDRWHVHGDTTWLTAWQDEPVARRLDTTTIRVSSKVGELAQAIAKTTGTHMSSVVEEAVKAYERKLFHDACRKAHDALRASPEELAHEEQEWAELDPSLMDGLDDEKVKLGTGPSTKR
jgi:predicted transcriptional regulator